jgi:purine-nucleoside phosphorylase
VSPRGARPGAPGDAPRREGQPPVEEQRARIAAAEKHLRRALPRGFTPEAAIVLGTGLGGVAEEIEGRVSIPYGSIPGFPVSTVQSHKGELLAGVIRGRRVLAMEGRFHYYEGWSLVDATFPVRVVRALGASTLVLTAASGGLNPLYRSGDLMVLDDHINLMGDSPLRGPNDDAAGPRFPDMGWPYDGRLLELAERTARDLKMPLRRGVYVAVPGPQLETRAEFRALRILGADAVGMSTVPECIAAVHAGMKVLAFAVITDMCLPDHLEPVDIDRILKTAAEAGPRLGRLLVACVERLPR